MSVTWRRSKIEPAHQHLSIAMQCRLLSISRSSYYYTPVPETEETLALTAVIQEAYIQGISTSSGDGLVKAMGMSGISKSQARLRSRSQMIVP